MTNTSTYNMSTYICKYWFCANRIFIGYSFQKRFSVSQPEYIYLLTRDMKYPKYPNCTYICMCWYWFVYFTVIIRIQCVTLSVTVFVVPVSACAVYLFPYARKGQSLEGDSKRERTMNIVTEFELVKFVRVFDRTIVKVDLCGYSNQISTNL